MIHELKIWPKYYEQVYLGNKTYEVRKNDREFKTGDKVMLREYDPAENTYTGNVLLFKVGYIIHLKDIFGNDNEYVIFSLLMESK